MLPGSQKTRLRLTLGLEVMGSLVLWSVGLVSHVLLRRESVSTRHNVSGTQILPKMPIWIDT